MNTGSILERILEWIIVYMGFSGILIAPIAWIIFIVTCLRLKSSYTEKSRKRRRIIRMVSLITAVLFTILLFLFFYFLSNGEGGTPLPTGTAK